VTIYKSKLGPQILDLIRVVSRLMNSLSTKSFFPWLILFSVGSAWGSGFALAKIATSDGAHPIGITFLQALIGAICLLLFCLLHGQKISYRRDIIFFYAVCALLGSAIPSTLYFYAAPFVSAGVMALSIATVPIMTYLVAILFSLEIMITQRMLGVLVGIIAVLMIVLPDDALSNTGSIMWVLLTFMAAACYAAENIFIAKCMPESENTVTVLTGMFIFATIFLAPIVFFKEVSVSLHLPWSEVEFALCLLAIINVFCYGLFIYLISISGPLFASQTAYINTLSGVAWGIILLDESHSLWIWIALGTMMVGLALVRPKKV